MWLGSVGQWFQVFQSNVLQRTLLEPRRWRLCILWNTENHLPSNMVFPDRTPESLTSPNYSGTSYISTHKMLFFRPLQVWSHLCSLSVRLFWDVQGGYVWVPISVTTGTATRTCRLANHAHILLQHSLLHSPIRMMCATLLTTIHTHTHSCWYV
jgi:hypothetical protein